MVLSLLHLSLSPLSIFYWKYLFSNIPTLVALTPRCHLQTKMLHQSLVQTFFLPLILMMTMIPTIKLPLVTKYYTLPLVPVSPILHVFLAIARHLLLHTSLSQVSTIFSFP
jgi:hypothetical protein